MSNIISPEKALQCLHRITPDEHGFRDFIAPPLIRAEWEDGSRVARFYTDYTIPDFGDLVGSVTGAVSSIISRLPFSYGGVVTVPLKKDLLDPLFNASPIKGVGEHFEAGVDVSGSCDVPLIDVVVSVSSVQGTYGIAGLQKMWHGFLRHLFYRLTCPGLIVGDVYINAHKVYISDEDFHYYYSRPYQPTLF